jgi:hypothetical protein
MEWEKAFTVEKERVQEYVELYESMGYEVKVVSAESCDEREECKVCLVPEKYVEILIRKKE